MSDERSKMIEMDCRRRIALSRHNIERSKKLVGLSTEIVQRAKETHKRTCIIRDGLPEQKAA